MSYPFSLKEVSQMFHIPITTLRYWEKHQLIQLQRNDVNNYKEFFFNDLCYVCDVDLYHNMGLKKNELKDLYSMSPDRISQRLAVSDRRVQEEIESLQTMRRKIEEHQQLLEKIKQLEKDGYVEADIDIEKIVSVGEGKEDLIRHGQNFLINFALVLDMKKDTHRLRYGFTAPADFPVGDTIFEKGASRKKYIRFLMKIPIENLPFPYERAPFLPYEKPYVENITRLYRPPERLILRFLLTASDEETGRPCFYEEAYAEIAGDER